MLVDTLGLLLVIMVTAANADDGTAAPRLLERVDDTTLPRLAVIFGDNKYRNNSLNAWMKRERPGWSIEVQSPPPGTKGFSPVRIRWVVERSNAWHGRCRRNSKDYERRTDSSETMIQISHIGIMLRRAAPGQGNRTLIAANSSVLKDSGGKQVRQFNCATENAQNHKEKRPFDVL